MKFSLTIKNADVILAIGTSFSQISKQTYDIDSSTKILGIKSRLPLFLAPLGSIDQLDISGAIAPALAAKEFGVASFVSSVCPPGMENTMTNAGGNLLFQLYDQLQQIHL